MTLFNIISVVVLAAVVAGTIVAYRRLKRVTSDAEGFGSVNERGDIGTSEEGDIVGEG